MYHRYLQLPFHPIFRNYESEIPNKKENHHVRIIKQHLDPRLVNWMDAHGLYVIASEYFYTAPDKTLSAHCDTLTLSNVVKMNWMYGGDDSLMDWYEMKPDKPLPQYQTIINTKFSIPAVNDIVLKQSFKIGKPSLINVGQVHGVRNGKHPRYVYSLVIGVTATQQRLEWDQAKEIFAKYIK
jgi:hypothetical protein